MSIFLNQIFKLAPTFNAKSALDANSGEHDSQATRWNQTPSAMFAQYRPQLY